MPELLKRLALAVRCLRSSSSNERVAFPLVAKLALLVRMNSTGGCSTQSVPHQLITLHPASGAWAHRWQPS